MILFLLIVAGVLAAGFGSKTYYGISEGTYRMETEEDSSLRPLIHFDMEGSDIRFVFGADERISFAYSGYVELDGKVKAHSENGGKIWIFEVVDNDTIRFIQKGSSEFPLKEGSIPDGAVFRYEAQK